MRVLCVVCLSPHKRAYGHKLTALAELNKRISIHIGSRRYAHRFPDYSQTVPDPTINEPAAPTHQPPPDAQIDALEQLFREVADDKVEIGWQELKQILDQSLRDGESR